MAPSSQGLYNPAFEHDACGVAMVADMHGRRSRDIVDKAITALVNLEHRGAQGAEPHTGDGAGILLQVPDEFLRAVVEFDLPEYGSYATGIAFLPQSSKDAATACEAVEKIAEAEGLEVLGWREVPTDESSLGALARDAMPTFRQLFLAGATGMDLERRAYVVRKRAEHELGTKGPGQDGPGRETVYFPSLSGQTFVYKGMLTTPQLKAFYLDLQDDRLTSALGIVHSRFSTNTFPSWPLAHPFRRIAHNGEINTVTGNENWMRAREALISTDVFGSNNSASVSYERACRSSNVITSAGRPSESVPVVAVMSSATLLPASAFRTASVTSAPAAASARAVSTPIPDEPPVTIARLPVKSTPLTTSVAVDSEPKGVVIRVFSAMARARRCSPADRGDVHCRPSSSIRNRGTRGPVDRHRPSRVAGQGPSSLRPRRASRP